MLFEINPLKYSVARSLLRLRIKSSFRMQGITFPFHEATNFSKINKHSTPLCCWQANLPKTNIISQDANLKTF